MADIQTFGKFDFNFDTQIMELQVAYVTITLQEIYDSAHDASANLNHMDSKIIARASGQNDLGGGLKTGLTVELVNGWRLKAADRGGLPFVRVAITGGNFITAEANGPDPTDPLAPANYVTYSLSKAVSATITADVAEWSQAEKDVVLVATPAIKNKTDNLPSDPVGEAALAVAHGAGSWEGATPTQLWEHNDRKLTSRDIESQLPEEHLPSEEQVQDIQAVLDAIKGLGFESTEDALRVIRQLVGASKATFKI